MCFWSEWLVRRFFFSFGGQHFFKWKMQPIVNHISIAIWPHHFVALFFFSMEIDCSVRHGGQRDAHENTNHKNGALCATEWARTEKKQPSHYFSKELLIRLRFIFKSHLLYWTRNTQTVLEKSIRFYHQLFRKTSNNNKKQTEIKRKGRELERGYGFGCKRQTIDINRTNVRLLSICRFSVFLLCVRFPIEMKIVRFFCCFRFVSTAQRQMQKNRWKTDWGGKKLWPILFF